MVPPTGMGSAPSCLHSGRGFICHWSIHWLYYNPRKPEAGTESQASGCMIPQSTPVSIAYSLRGSNYQRRHPARAFSALPQRIPNEGLTCTSCLGDRMNGYSHFDHEKTFRQSILHPFVQQTQTSVAKNLLPMQVGSRMTFLDPKE